MARTYAAAKAETGQSFGIVAVFVHGFCLCCIVLFAGHSHCCVATQSTSSSIEINLSFERGNFFLGFIA